MKFKNTIILIITVVCSLCFYNCSKGHRIKLPADYTNVYVLDKKIEGFLPDRNKNKFILYASRLALIDCLPELYMSPIDSLMEANKEWEMIIYYKGFLRDTTEVFKITKKFDCQIPVVFNEYDQFLDVNKIDKKWGSMSFFLDKKNTVIGRGWLVGGPPFIEQFEKTKRLM